MDARSELARERSALVKADTDLREGEARVGAQVDLVAHLRARLMDTREAEQLVDVLRQTLSQWEQHRVLIVQRIAYLETKLAQAGAAPAGLDP